MRSQKIFILTVLILSLALGSCAGAAPASVNNQEAQMKPTSGPAADEDMQSPESEDHSADMMMEEMDGEAEMAEDSEMDSGSSMEMSAPDWFDAELTNVQNGETFTINELHGKVVLVETMAIWCSNCLKQQKEVLSLHEMLGMREDFVSLGLDIDPNEEADGLKNYIEKNGFNWPYVVAGADLSREFSDLYGSQYLNPPSTPMLIIDRSGEAHLLPFGIKSAETLQEALQPYLDEPM